MFTTLANPKLPQRRWFTSTPKGRSVPWARSHRRTQGPARIDRAQQPQLQGRRSGLPDKGLAECFSIASEGGPPCPETGGACVENSKESVITRARALSVSPKRTFKGTTTAAGVACGGGANLSDLGRSATSSPAMASNRRPKAGSPGNAAISRESRAVAKSPDICARSIASCHGSRPDRPSAEITLSNCPCRSSPMDAKRNGSNSRPMRGANAA
jgi:hypothetical protein